MRRWNDDLLVVQSKAPKILEQLENDRIEAMLDKFGNENYEKRKNQILDYFENLKNLVEKFERTALVKLEEEYRNLRIMSKLEYEEREKNSMDENKKKLEEICKLETKGDLTLADLKNYFRFKEFSKISDSVLSSAEKIVRRKKDSLITNVSSLDLEFVKKDEIFGNKEDLVKYFDNVKLSKEIRNSTIGFDSDTETCEKKKENDVESLLDMSLNSLDSELDFETQYDTLINSKIIKSSPKPDRFSCRTLNRSHTKKSTNSKNSEKKFQVFNFGSILRQNKNTDRNSLYSNFNTKRTTKGSPLRRKLNYESSKPRQERNDYHLFEPSIKKKKMQRRRRNTLRNRRSKENMFYSYLREDEENNKLVLNTNKMNTFISNEESFVLKPKKKKYFNKFTEIVKRTRRDNLDFTASNVTDNILETIAPYLRTNNSIKKVKLSMNEITDKGLISAFSQLKGKKFKSLYLGQNKITEKGFFYLTSLLASKILQVDNLYLQHNQINPEDQKINLKTHELREMGINIIL